jgi:hypothetical protein
MEHAKELYFCPCGGEAMKKVTIGVDKLAAGGVACYKCGQILGPETFDEAYACDEDGRITE